MGEADVKRVLQQRGQQRRLTSAAPSPMLGASSSGVSGSSASAGQQWTGYAMMSASKLEDLQRQFDTLPALPEGVRPGVTTAEAEDAVDAAGAAGAAGGDDPFAEDWLMEGEERGDEEEEVARAGAAKRMRGTEVKLNLTEHH